MHTYMHARTRIYTHDAYIQAWARANIHAHTHARTPTHARARTCVAKQGLLGLQQLPLWAVHEAIGAQPGGPDPAAQGASREDRQGFRAQGLGLGF